MNDIWSEVTRLISRFRGALIGGIASAAAVALTLDPSSGLARSSMRFSLWFAIVATTLALPLTVLLTVSEVRAARPQLPRATARRSRS